MRPSVRVRACMASGSRPEIISAAAVAAVCRPRPPVREKRRQRRMGSISLPRRLPARPLSASPSSSSSSLPFQFHACRWTWKLKRRDRGEVKGRSKGIDRQQQETARARIGPAAMRAVRACTCISPPCVASCGLDFGGLSSSNNRRPSGPGQLAGCFRSIDSSIDL